MKIVTKRDGKFIWVALKDKKGIYHCPADDSHWSKNLVSAGHLYSKDMAMRVKEMLKREGHKDR